MSRPPAGVTIREFRRSDRPFLRRCLETLQDWHVGLDRWRVNRRTPAYGALRTRRVLESVAANHGFILVAEAKGRPVGLVTAWFIRDERVERLRLRPSRGGFLGQLVVVPRWRNRGIGTRLLEAAERRLIEGGCDTIGLSAFVGNPEAHRLYRKLGYEERAVKFSKRVAPYPKSWAEVRRDLKFRAVP